MFQHNHDRALTDQLAQSVCLTWVGDQRVSLMPQTMKESQLHATHTVQQQRNGQCITNRKRKLAASALRITASRLFSATLAAVQY